jgi:hypothetical protein
MANYKKERVWTPHDVNKPEGGGYYKTVVTELPSTSTPRTKGLDPNFKRKSGEVSPMIINMAKGIDEAFRKTGIFGKHFTAEAINERRKDKLNKRVSKGEAAKKSLDEGSYKKRKKREGRLKGNFLFPLGGERYKAGK